MTAVQFGGTVDETVGSVHRFSVHPAFSRDGPIEAEDTNGIFSRLTECYGRATIACRQVMACCGLEDQQGEEKGNGRNLFHQG